MSNPNAPQTPKTWLFRVPNPGVVRVVQPNAEGVQTYMGDQLVSAFAGIDEAIRYVGFNGQNLVENLRLLRKFEKAAHKREPGLDFLYIEVTESEKNTIVSAGAGFNWSAYAAQTGNSLWIHWMDLLEIFDTESEAHARAFRVYDPMNPDAEYVEFKRWHAERLAAYEKQIAEAEAKALADKQAETKSEAAPVAEPEVIEAEAVEVK